MTWTTRRLLAHLGPWADESRAPSAVERRTLVVPPSSRDARPMEARVYVPLDRAPRGAYLIAHGLHYLGPDDPRMDRFLRVLAHAGHIAVCPLLPSYISLTVDARVTEELARGLTLLERLDDVPKNVRPGIFSISFGSLPAYRLAARPDAGERIGSVVVFGGYVDFVSTLRFALGERSDDTLAPPRDPLNLPVVVMNLLSAMETLPVAPERVVPHWLRYVRATWGRKEMKARERHHAVAHDIARDIDDEDARRFFLVGTGVLPGARELCLAALARIDTRPFDPRDAIVEARVPLHGIHGVDDDVIPYTELARLAALAPLAHVPVTTSLTGLFAHTGGPDDTSLTRRATLGVREAATLWSMLRIVRDAGRVRRS